MSSDAVINLSNLGKCYRIYEKPRDRLLQMLFRGRKQYGKEYWALNGVDLSINSGEVIGIIGRNGSGKSTLLQLVCGTLAPTHGDVEVRGRVAALLELGAGFNPEFTGRENVFLNAAVMGITAAEIAERFDEILDFAGIGSFIDQPVKTYSSGMYVRLAFAIATSVDPDILVIDEALSVGDGAFARKSFDRIMLLKEKGATILFCSHSMYHIEAICNRVLWLNGGKVSMLDEPEKVVSAYSESLVVENESLNDQLHESSPAPEPGKTYIKNVFAMSNGDEGRRLHVRSCQTDLRIRIEFCSDPEMPAPGIAFSLENHAKVGISSAGSRYDGFIPNRSEDGSGVAELFFPKIPLMRGTYYFQIYLTCERLIHVYDHAAYCVELEVSQPGIEQGVVFLPHQWRDVS